LSALFTFFGANPLDNEPIQVEIVEDDGNAPRMIDGRVPLGTNDWMQIGIYRLRFSDGSTYIGSSTRSSRRMANHLWEMKKGSHYNPLVQASWNKTGSVSREMVLICRSEDLLFYEQLCLDGLNPDLNLNLAARSSQPVSDASRLKRSMAMKGKNTQPRTAEWREKISKTLRQRAQVESRPQDVRERIGRKSKERWDNMSPEERAEIGRKSAAARKAKREANNVGH